MSLPTPTPDARSATVQALRSALAAVMCLGVAAWFGLQHANLAVWTTHMVMAQYTFTSFQKGLERVLGRGFGIFAGVVVTTWFDEVPFLGLSLISVLLLVCFYLYFADRLAYTFLNAGLYAVVLFMIGHSNPNAVVDEGKEMFLAVLVGVLIADVVTWLTGAEHDLTIQAGTAPLLPIRLDWLNHSLMLVVTVALTSLGSHWLELPAEQAAVSVLFLTVTPHIHAMLLKGELRITGALLAAAWATGTFLVMALQPKFLLLAGLLFLGQFLAAYLTRTGGTYSYAGVQMGLVLPMLIVAPPQEFGSLTPAVERLAGILVALAASLMVGGLWPRFPVRSEG
jgi:uncharacterized membrane protein YccC